MRRSRSRRAVIAQWTQADTDEIFALGQRGEGHLDRISLLNSRFHRLLLAAANSPRLDQALASLLEAPLIMKTFRRYSIDSLERSALHHLELVQAFEAQDSEWAASVMRAHILAAKVAIKPD